MMGSRVRRFPAEEAAEEAAEVVVGKWVCIVVTWGRLLLMLCGHQLFDHHHLLIDDHLLFSSLFFFFWFLFKVVGIKASWFLFSLWWVVNYSSGKGNETFGGLWYNTVSSLVRS